MVSNDFFPKADELRQREQDRQNHLVYSALLDSPGDTRVCLRKAVVYPDQEPETETWTIANVGNSQTAEALVKALNDLQSYVAEQTDSSQQGAAALCFVGETIGEQGRWLPWVRAGEPLFRDDSLPEDPFLLPRDCPKPLIPPHSSEVEALLTDIYQFGGQDVSIKERAGELYLGMVFEERFEKVIDLKTFMSPEEEKFVEAQLRRQALDALDHRIEEAQSEMNSPGGGERLGGLLDERETLAEALAMSATAEKVVFAPGQPDTVAPAEEPQPDQLFYDVFAKPDTGGVYLAKSTECADNPAVKSSEVRFLDNVGSPQNAEALVSLLREMQVYSDSEQPGQGNQALCAVCQVIGTDAGFIFPGEDLFSRYSDLPPDPFPTAEFPEALQGDPVVGWLVSQVAWVTSGFEDSGAPRQTKEAQLLAQLHQLTGTTDRHIIEPTSPTIDF